MDLEPTEEHVMLRDGMRRLLATHDPADPATAFAALCEMGVAGACLPEDAGGFGGAGADIAVVFAELGRAGARVPVLGSAVLAGRLLADLGTPAQRALLEGVVDGSRVVALAHGEAAARYDLERVETRHDGGALTGTKTQVLDGAGAGLFIVSAREEGAVDDPEGISLFLVERDAPGVACKPLHNIDGTTGAILTLTDAAVSEDARLGARGGAFAALETARAHAILAVCAEAVGAMDAALALTVDYLNQRTQFGKPLSSFQVLRHGLADLAIEIEQARSAVLNCADALDADPRTRDRHASAAKNLTGRVALRVAEDCIQMHGGMGMTNEYALAHLARRLVMIDHVFGDSDYHLDRFVSLTDSQGRA